MADDLRIMTERIGLPKEATPEQVISRVHMLGDENRELKGKVDELVKMLSEAQLQVADGRKAKEDLKEQEGRLLCERQVAKHVIDKSDLEYWVERYTENPEATKKYFAEHAFRAVIATQQSLQGPLEAYTPDPQAELDVKTAEVLANDTTKKMSEAEAVQKVYAKDPGLFQRVTESRRKLAEAKGGGKGGER